MAQTLLFSAEHAIEQFLDKDKHTPKLAVDVNGSQAFVTAFRENKKEVLKYKKRYKDAYELPNDMYVVPSNVSEGFFIKVSKGKYLLDDSSLMNEQSKELCQQVKSRPLFDDICQETLVLVH